ncbi:unnamed protein product, partial [marine sediment metagenome]
MGFAGAVNLGVNLSSGDIIVLLNPDVVVKEKWLLSLIEAFKVKEIGIVGSIILDSNQSFIQHAGAVIKKNGITEHIELNLEEVSLEDNEGIKQKIKEKLKSKFGKN